jgi:predicted GNAT superfamily acetyltransferase
MPPSEEITIRPLESEDDFAVFEALQRETWGKNLAEVVTGSLAKIVQKIGGIAAGAFNPGGEMIGFVFGFAGYREGRPIHWSHMLAVRSEVRDRGIGRRLKLYQRETLLKAGVTEVYWTYDPLVARNAHLNFITLGAQATEYVADMYGSGDDSDLFRGLGTDRFIVVWRIATDRVAKAIDGKKLLELSAYGLTPIVVSRANEAEPNSPPGAAAFPEASKIRIEIPPDIHQLRDLSASAAWQWRGRTREAFQYYLANQYEVTEFYRDESTKRCFYCLDRGGKDTL